MGCTFGNHVLQLRLPVSIKQTFQPYIRHYTFQNENFEYVYPHSNANAPFSIILSKLFKTLLNFFLNFSMFSKNRK